MNITLGFNIVNGPDPGDTVGDTVHTSDNQRAESHLEDKQKVTIHSILM